MIYMAMTDAKRIVAVAKEIGTSPIQVKMAWCLCGINGVESAAGLLYGLQEKGMTGIKLQPIAEQALLFSSHVE